MNFRGYAGFGRFGDGAAIGMGMGIAASMMANGGPRQVETQSDPQRPPPKKPRPKAEAAKPPPPPPPKAVAPRPPPAEAVGAEFTSRARPAPAGETRFRRGEVFVSTSPGVVPTTVPAVLQRHGLVEVEATYIALTTKRLGSGASLTPARSGPLWPNSAARTR